MNWDLSNKFPVISRAGDICGLAFEWQRLLVANDFRFNYLVGSVICIFAFASYLSSAAQENANSLPKTDLAIQLKDGYQFPISSSPDGYVEIGPPDKLANWKQPSDTAPLTRIRIHGFIEGDGVRVRIGGVFDDSQPVDAPGPKYGEKEKIIASYLAHIGETITVDDLERFGFRPLVITIVPDDGTHVPKTETPLATFPLVKNDLKSIGVVDWRPSGPQATDGRLILKNLTGLNIVCLTLGVTGGFTETIEGTRARPIAAPGATFEEIIGLGQERLDEHSAVVIVTVLFGDGSFEGDLESAAQLAARLRGREIQLTRFLQLLRKAMADGGAGAGDVLQTLRPAVENFRIDVDPHDVEELRSRFGLSSDKARVLIAEKIMEGLKQVRSHALYMIRDVDPASGNSTAPRSPQQSLLALQERVEKLVGNQ